MVQGLAISITGMSLTFAALGLLILIMVMLVRLFPVRREAKEVSGR
jgi:Na+-transporting methylmalonyl-CoA/oxaloacetate decarboxylase gamma subunit